MKKSAWLLIVGICIIVLTFVLDAFLSNSVLDMSEPSEFEATHYVAIVGAGLLVIAGIVMIIVSRKMAQKGK